MSSSHRSDRLMKSTEQCYNFCAQIPPMSPCLWEQMGAMVSSQDISMWEDVRAALTHSALATFAIADAVNTSVNSKRMNTQPSSVSNLTLPSNLLLQLGMYSRSLSRAARTSSTISSVPTTAHRILPSAVATTPSPSSHQRRPSSSKTSCPPGGNRNPEQPTNDASANTAEGDKPAASEGEKRSSQRLSRRKLKDEAGEVVKARDDAFANVPAVPTTSHLHLADVAISTFFSLHRPISVTLPIPPHSSTQSFNAIFDPPKSNSAHKPNDVVYTLSSAIRTLEDSSRSSEETNLRREILANSSSNAEPEQITHLNGQPVQTLEDLARAFRPFNKPPAPVPFEEDGQPSISGDGRQKNDRVQSLMEQQQAEAADAESAHRRPSASQVQQSGENKVSKPEGQISTKMYASTFSVRETVHPSGEKSYVAYGSPLRRSSIRASHSHGRPFALPHLSQQYLGRIVAMQDSQVQGTAEIAVSEDRGALDSVNVGVVQEVDTSQPMPAMEVISVKRQRKLKMKKHKYKKLMRRTRNLRKREGRL